MKRIVLLFCLSCLSVLMSLAQTPDGFNYQGVARNSSGVILTNQNISLQMSILMTNATGSAVYSETHTATSNDYGVFDLVVGSGSIITGDFSTIDWRADLYFLKVEMDGTGGTNYELMGTTQLLSVPYALHSKTAENAYTVDYDSIINVPANLTTIVNNNFSGDYTDLTNTPSIPINVSELNNDAGYLSSEVDGNITNEIQIISISNDTIYLTDGGYAVLPEGFSGDYGDLINQPSIPVNVSELTNDVGYITSPDDNDSDTTNELQVLSVSNDTIFLTDGGFVKIPPAEISPITTISDNVTATYTDNTAYLSLGALAPTGNSTETKFKFDASKITANRSYILPDNDGTVALTNEYTVGTYYPDLGGIVFQVNSITPNTIGSTGTHGLVASPSDQSTGCNWYSAQNAISTYNTANSEAMIYCDWCLPSYNELTIMAGLSTTIGGFVSAYYWSSTESDNTNAWIYYLNFGVGGAYPKANAYRVRAVRAF